MFKNNWTICRFIIRRDWLRIIFWFFGTTALVVGFGAALPNLFGTEEGRAGMLSMMENPALVAMMGPIYYQNGTAGIEGFTLGAMYSLFMVIWSVMILAVMNIFHVIRHTRQDEEYGRIEVIRSLPVGRLSNLSATLTSAVIINTAFSLLLGLGLSAVNTESMGFAGSMLFGAAMGTIGLVFAAIAAIFCQLCANPRTAAALSFFTLGAAYMLRAVGDMEKNEIISCLSPIGLIYRTRIYTENQWWPVFILLMVTVAISLFAFLLCRARDMGEGIIPARPGKKDAAKYLSSPSGLSWRLLRTPFIVWAVTIPVLSASYGSIMGDVDAFVKAAPPLMQLTGGSSLKMASFLMVIMSLCSTIPILNFILKARSEEKRGYAENIIARSASRHSQLRGYFVIAIFSCVLMPFLNALGFYAAGSVVMDEPFRFPDVFNTCMVYAPAMIFMLGAAMLLIGYFPKYASFSYGYLGYAFAAIYMGGMMNAPEWLGKLSPFGHIPMLPKVEETGQIEVFAADGTLQIIPEFGSASFSLDGGDIAALSVMTALAVTMCILGFIGYSKRDMEFTQ
ncbi:MAG: hypothetical protein FWG69_04935 [Oscillospiraceae bacterium]|nr:hypothetical protein [Oscillospiraceae bacterium]